MVKKWTLLYFFLVLWTLVLHGQTQIGAKTAVGRWQTFDDANNQARSVVEIYEQNGLLFGRIQEIYFRAGEDRNARCTACKSSDGRYNQRIQGMIIIRNMKDRGSKYADGDILDPEKGAVYSCTMWLESADVLKVRGWWGLAYRTQTWRRLP